MLPPDPTAQQVAEFAAACELTGDLKGARENYERALAGGLRKKVSWLLLRLIVRDDPVRATVLLRETPELWKETEVRQWSQAFVERNELADALSALVEFGRFVEKALDVMGNFPSRYY